MASLITPEEINQIFEDFERLKKKAAGNDNSTEARRVSLVQKQGQSNVKVFIKNDACDLNNHLNNDSKPYYIANFHDLTPENQAKVTVIPEEVGECKVAALKAPNALIKLESTLEYSAMANTGIPDMVEIDELNPASLLYNLAIRYKRDDIYTYVGPILLVLNPFKAIPQLGLEETRLQYVEIVKSDTPFQLKKNLPPHSYALSALAYYSLRNEGNRQGIVISGESGAGKTESAKVCMEFLTKLAAMNQAEGEKDIGKQILACNPILEGFGNAKTVRNDNSSRFGKYTLMYFGTQEDKVFGARIKNYLLEKSRVVMVSPNERGYHIFYFLLGGSDLNRLRDLGLTKPDGKARTWNEFKYLATGGERPGEDAQKELKEVVDTMQDMAFSQEEQDSIWRCVAAILHMGQIEFDKASFDDDKSPSKPGKIKNEDVAILIANLLGYEDPAMFTKILLNSVNVINKQELWNPQGMSICVNNRDALAKKLYDNMFNWLVARMNATIEPEQLEDPGFSSIAKTIGLLDIFGFENFEMNQFEQFCINYVNEKLHKLYIAAIFEAEKQDLTEEGLAEVANRIEYPKTQVLEILRLMDFEERSVKYKGIQFPSKPPMGIFTLVDAKCNNPKQDVKWEDIMTEISNAHKANKEVFAQKNPRLKEKFQINHSAQTVIYDVKEFRMRNIDNIPQGLEDSMQTNTHELVKNIYMGKVRSDEESKVSKDKTIWKKFGRQMDDLMLELGEPLIVMGPETGRQIPPDAEPCQLHFIRCIKPRPKPLSRTDKPGLFVHSMTLQQITYMGVLESVDLKQKNYPFRKKFEEFYAEYELLSPRYALKRYYQMDKSAEDFKALTVQIFEQCLLGLGQDKYAIGNSKVLMMPQIKQVLDKCMEEASKLRNMQAKHLKQAFGVFNAIVEAKKKFQTMKCVQDRYRRNYLRKQRAQAERFKEIFEKAIITYKADRRQIQEQKAGKRIQDVLMRHEFRNKLAHGLKARETIVKHTYNRAYINRIGKLLLCMTLQKRIVNNAFSMAKKSINERATWNIQRAIRGHMAREKKMDVVKKAIEEKENLRLHVSAKKIQKRLKGLIVRRRIDYVHKIASRIQAYFRMRWFRQVFYTIKSNTMVLQRAVRRYMARRDMIKERMRDYLMQEYQSMENVREMESFMLFGDEKNGGIVKQQTPYSAKKIFLFSRLVDQHVITDLSDMHSTPWSSQFMKLYKDNIVNDTPIMQLTVGQSHSLACTGRGRTYVWGWNDNGQCAKDPLMVDEVIVRSSKSAQIDLQKFTKASLIPGQPELAVRTKQVLAVEDRCIIQLHDGGTEDLIVWGGNERGQLGLGHYQDVHEPTRLSFFSKQQLKVSSFAAGGNLTLAACETGESFAWPFTMHGQKVSYPVKMPFSESIKIKRVSCGYNFGFFISQQGHVYAVGKDNQDGQLGLGHVYPNDIPEIVQCFKEAGERIDSIECGFRHAIARSTLGKVYTWGWNAHGQLGHGTFESELSPRQVNLERGKLNKDKAIQIAAGYSHSVIMTEQSRDILWFGTSGSLQRQSTPVQMMLSDKLPSLYPAATPYGYPVGQQVDFANVKVTCTWSKTLSVTNLMMADLRAINADENYSKISQVLDRLSRQWDQREVMPPYVEVIANLFSANVMRKGGKGGRAGGLTQTEKTQGKKNLTSTVRSTLQSGRSTPYKR